MSKTSPFWCVWNPTYGVPTVKHRSRDVALAEAKRLARCNPGQDFYVLAGIAHVVKNDCLVTRIGAGPDFDEEIPF